jgi:hypothetical protein
MQSYNLIALVGIAIVSFPSASPAQTTLAGWDFNGLTNFGPSPYSPTATASGVTVGGLTRGSGVGTGGTAATGGWGGTGWNQTSAATAVTAGTVATFTIAPTAGNALSLSAVSPIEYRRSTAGAQSGDLQYSLDGTTFTTITTLSYTSTSSSGAALGPVDLTGISALQNVGPGTTVTFRLANYGGTASTGTWYLYDVGTDAGVADFGLTGTITPVPEPGICVGLAAVGLAARRAVRRRPIVS